MKVKKFTLVLILMVSGILNVAFANNAWFSLITVGQGDELYSTFGHSALRYYDPEKGIDRIYNYGTFDFNDPDFYIKFTRGKLDYMLSVSTFRNLLHGAHYENRNVVEQILDLDHEDVAALYHFLETNYLPENRFYKYDFFFDNCSTRIRDALAKICGEKLKYNFQPESTKSFRQLIDEFLTEKKFQDLGMDIGLGSPADRKATAYDYMFLPEYLFLSFEEASIEKKGEIMPLVKKTIVHYEASPKEAGAFAVSPALITWLMFLVVLGLSIYNFKTRRILYSGDVILFGFTGVLGVLLLLLWFATDHAVTAYNWDLAWAMPLNLLAVVFLWKKKYKLIQKYMLGYAGLLIVFLVGLPVIPQEINYAVIPLVLLLIIRSLYISLKIRRERSVGSDKMIAKG